MSFPFRLRKAIQATHVLLDCQFDDTMEYMRLLKLLYIAERESLEETGVPIIGSRVVAMKNGPLHSRVYDLIKQEGIDEDEWSKYFQTIDNEIRVRERPGVESLSRYEIRKLREVHARFDDIDTWELVDSTHSFPEWRDNYPDPQENTSNSIPIEDILKAVGRDADTEAILEDAKEDREIDRLLSN